MLLLLPSQNNAKVAQLVEHDLAKVGVASSNLVFRSFLKATSKGLLFLCTLSAQSFPEKYNCIFRNFFTEKNHLKTSQNIATFEVELVYMIVEEVKKLI